MTGDGEEIETEIEVDFRFLAGSPRPLGRTLGAVARQFLEDGGPPPVPVPTIGLLEGGTLPLLYPGLNAIVAASGTGKSLMVKAIAREEVGVGRHVVVLDAETTVGEYAGTLLADLRFGPGEMELVHYATNVQGRDPFADRWLGNMTEDLLNETMDGVMIEDPSLVLIDSMSKSMAALGLDENRPTDTTRWFEAVTVPVLNRWPKAAVALLQARQKGWYKGMDVRQGRGSSSLLHEVKAQYMMWTKKPGSRTVDGLANVVCTKDRYGHRAEGSLAAHWLYGPTELALWAPIEGMGEATAEQIEVAVVELLADDPRDDDPKCLGLPLTRTSVENMVARSLSIAREKVTPVLGALVKAGEVHCERLPQPSKTGPKPERVWAGSDTRFS